MSPSAPRCSNHPSLEINAYCATCNLLICSSCGLKEHKRHDVDLLEDVDEKHRQQLKDTVYTIKNSIKEWENNCHTHDNNLQEELSLIEQKKQELFQSANATFDTLISIVHGRHQEIVEKINTISSAKRDLVLKLQSLKIQAKTKLNQFDDIDNLPTIEIMEMKINQLNGLYQSLSEMRSCFDQQIIESLHSFALANIVPQTEMISMSVQKLGEVIGQPQTNHVQPLMASYVPVPVNMANVTIKVKLLTGGLVNKLKLDKFTNLEELKLHLRGLLKIQEDIVVVDVINGSTFPITNIQELKNREECYYVSILKH